jgi:hypothetical protein
VSENLKDIQKFLKNLSGKSHFLKLRNQFPQNIHSPLIKTPVHKKRIRKGFPFLKKLSNFHHISFYSSFLPFNQMRTQSINQFFKYFNLPCTHNKLSSFSFALLCTHNDEMRRDRFVLEYTVCCLWIVALNKEFSYFFRFFFQFEKKSKLTFLNWFRPQIQTCSMVLIFFQTQF